jgi:hypothetical protein
MKIEKKKKLVVGQPFFKFPFFFTKIFLLFWHHPLGFNIRVLTLQTFEI